MICEFKGMTTMDETTRTGAVAEKAEALDAKAAPGTRPPG
jgi:hypothetical protein